MPYSSHTSSSSSSLTCLCRICYEEEENSTTSMESPCSCSGSLKFAHKECIQKWCDVKGSTICEICLEKFEPGYTISTPSPANPHVIDVVITIRESLEIARLNNELQVSSMAHSARAQRQQELADSSPATSDSIFQLLASLFTMMFLLKDIVMGKLVENDNYTYTLCIVFLLRAAGILLPLYLMIKLICAIRNARRRSVHA